jgi:hypothetical protein
MLFLMTCLNRLWLIRARRAPGSVNICRERVFLSSETEFRDDGAVAVNILVFDVIQQSPPLADHDQQASSGMMILVVGFQMIRQMGNPSGQQCDLNFRRSCIGFVKFKPVNGL